MACMTILPSCWRRSGASSIMGYARWPATVGGPYWVSVPPLTSHGFDFHIFTALCSNSNRARRRADWVPILGMLKKSRKRLINWCPSVDFPIEGRFPQSRRAYRDIMKMFFNPDPARRLRLVPIEGKSQDLFNSCYGTLT